MSDTPRTDAEVFWAQEVDSPRTDAVDCVDADFARQMERALREIAKGEGAFSRDPLEHAKNTIANMQAIARAAIATDPAKDAR
jgi:hypothetical protein